MHLTLHELACLRNELVWVYDHAPGSLKKTVQRRQESGNWAWYLREGRVDLRYKGKTIRVEPGQWIMLPEGTTKHHFSSEARLLSLHFRSQWPTGDNLLRILQPIVLTGEQYPRLLKHAVRLQRFLRRNFPEVESYRLYRLEYAGYPQFLQLQMHFYAWLKEWMEVMAKAGANWSHLGTEDERLQTAVRILNEAPLADGLPRERLTAATGLSLVQLNRLFTRDLGLSTRKFWDKRLLRQAQDALGSHKAPVKELAYRLGFRSDSLFVNWFRRRTGKSPGQFRQANTGD